MQVLRDFPGGPVVDSALLMLVAWVRSLVGKLRAHMAWPKEERKLGEPPKCRCLLVRSGLRTEGKDIDFVTSQRSF